jgi:hypothetical protein
VVDLIVEMEEMLLGRDDEKVGLEQGDIEVPRQIAPEGGLSDAVAAVYCDDRARPIPEELRQGRNDLRVGWKNGRQNWARWRR